MADCFIGEIRMFGGNFAPQDWSTCDGQTLAITQNEALFSLIGTYYGGNGYQNFNLPDLRGRVPVHQSQAYYIGMRSGAEQVTIDSTTMPGHTHPLAANATTTNATTNPAGKLLCQTANPGGNQPGWLYTASAGTTAALHPSSVTANYAGSTQPHNNMMPTLCVNFIIALNGFYPPRG